MKTKFLLSLLLAVISAKAWADVSQPEEASGVSVALSGFATLGASHSSQGLGDYVLDSTLPSGPGRSGSWTVGNDSRLGAQANVTFSPQTSAVLQVISEYQADGSYRPLVEWANVRYAFTPDTQIRLGRIVLPTFMHSESRKVGYGLPWVHPPVDLYRVQAITSSDGLDVMRRFELGDTAHAVKALYGRNVIDRPTSVSTSRDLWGIFDTVEYAAATLHLGYQERNASSLNLLTGIQGAWIKNSDLSAGFNYDPGEWFVTAEWIQRRSTTNLAARYVSAGYRYGNFTPYVTLSSNGVGSFLPGFPPPTAAAIVSANKSQSTVSLGGRWDFMKNADFKLQYDRVRLSGNSNGYLINLPANAVLHGTAFHVVTAAVDFIF